MVLVSGEHNQIWQYYVNKEILNQTSYEFRPAKDPIRKYATDPIRKIRLIN